MSGRALLFDVGNTSLKWGVLDGDQLVRFGKLSHQVLNEVGFTSLARKLPRQVNEVLVSNVAGEEFAAQLSSFVSSHCGVEARFARSERQAHGVTSGYKRPRRLGVDRWAAMIGARAQVDGVLCVVDAGSAITIDAIDQAGLKPSQNVVAPRSSMPGSAPLTAARARGRRWPPARRPRSSRGAR